jgi:hypothetical protein
MTTSSTPQVIILDSLLQYYLAQGTPVPSPAYIQCTDVKVVRLKGDDREIVQGDTIALVATAKFRYAGPSLGIPGASTSPPAPTTAVEANAYLNAGLPVGQILFEIIDTGEIIAPRAVSFWGDPPAQTLPANSTPMLRIPVPLPSSSISSPTGAMPPTLSDWVNYYFSFTFAVGSALASTKGTSHRPSVKPTRYGWVGTLATGGINSEYVDVDVEIAQPGTPPGLTAAAIVVVPSVFANPTGPITTDLADVTRTLAAVKADMTNLHSQLGEVVEQVKHITRAAKAR